MSMKSDKLDLRNVKNDSYAPPVSPGGYSGAGKRVEAESMNLGRGYNSIHQDTFEYESVGSPKLRSIQRQIRLEESTGCDFLDRDVVADMGTSDLDGYINISEDKAQELIVSLRDKEPKDNTFLERRRAELAPGMNKCIRLHNNYIRSCRSDDLADTYRVPEVLTTLTEREMTHIAVLVNRSHMKILPIELKDEAKGVIYSINLKEFYGFMNIYYMKEGRKELDMFDLMRTLNERTKTSLISIGRDSMDILFNQRKNGLEACSAPNNIDEATQDTGSRAVSQKRACCVVS